MNSLKTIFLLSILLILASHWSLRATSAASPDIRSISIDTFPSPVLEPAFGPDQLSTSERRTNNRSSRGTRNLSDYNYLGTKGINTTDIPGEYSEDGPFFKQDKVIITKPILISLEHTKLFKVPTNYNGYMVEIVLAEKILAKDHVIFTQHGNITVDKLPNDSYSYLLGDFDKEQEASAFLSDTLEDRYPEARVIGYESGRRLN